MKYIFYILLLLVNSAISAQERTVDTSYASKGLEDLRRLTTKELVSFSGEFSKPLSFYHGLQYHFAPGDSIFLYEYGEQEISRLLQGKRVILRNNLVSLPTEFGNKISFLIYAFGENYFLIEASRDQEFRKEFAKACAKSKQHWHHDKHRTLQTQEDSITFSLLWTKMFFVDLHR